MLGSAKTPLFIGQSFRPDSESGVKHRLKNKQTNSLRINLQDKKC